MIRWSTTQENSPGARWFVGARLNFAENLLRYRDANTSIIYQGQDEKRTHMTYAELYQVVARAADVLRNIGIRPGNRIAGCLPNLAETVVAMLAATSLGAIWTSCAMDIGPQAPLSRLGQVRPKV
jgi:acetoacetyl-CoA synthetase